MNEDYLYDLADKIPAYRAPDPWVDDRDVIRHIYWKHKILPMRGKIVKLKERRNCSMKRSLAQRCKVIKLQESTND